MTVRTSTLANGLRVVTDHMDRVETVSVGVWVNAGTRNERAEVNGVSHLLEHMAFKGTKRRSARAIAEEIEAVGGHLNAYTSRENTAYYAKVLKEDAGLAVDIIADILQHSVMNVEELERERAVVIQEINQAYDTPDDMVFDNFQITAYPDQALGRPVLGTQVLVDGMGRDTLLGYMHDHYGAGDMVLAAAGKIDHDDLLELAGRTFGNLPKSADPGFEAARYRGGESREERDLEQVNIVLGFEGIPFSSDDFYTLSVLSTLFGGGMSSRLFQEIREKRGLVYSIYSFPSSYVDGGLFGIHAGTGEDEAAELIPLVCAEINKLKDGVSEDEVARARAQIKAGILMSMESTSSRCEQLARQMTVFGRPLNTVEIVENIEAVEGPAILDLAGRLFSGTPTLASLGPVSKIEDFDKILKRLD
ncbi:MAG TPA: insulinase family protein [Rhodospirillales bacterium]|nr:insulinase family protein [Rhodospirillales bacterium]